MNWHPAETAPKDTEVLVWDGLRLMLATHDFAGWYNENGYPISPTHWAEWAPPE